MMVFSDKEGRRSLSFSPSTWASQADSANSLCSVSSNRKALCPGFAAARPPARASAQTCSCTTSGICGHVSVTHLRIHLASLGCRTCSGAYVSAPVLPCSSEAALTAPCWQQDAWHTKPKQSSVCALTAFTSPHSSCSCEGSLFFW